MKYRTIAGVYLWVVIILKKRLYAIWFKIFQVYLLCNFCRMDTEYILDVNQQCIWISVKKYIVRLLLPFVCLILFSKRPIAVCHSRGIAT